MSPVNFYLIFQCYISYPKDKGWCVFMGHPRCIIVILLFKYDLGRYRPEGYHLFCLQNCFEHVNVSWVITFACSHTKSQVRNSSQLLCIHVGLWVHTHLSCPALFQITIKSHIHTKSLTPCSLTGKKSILKLFFLIQKFPIA